MKREELEKAIENGESVWLVDEEENKIEELHFYKNNMYNFDKNDLFINKFWIYEFRKLFKTKAEAEHYLHHANIKRVESLPFLTWEEFNEDTSGFEFADNIGNKYRCHIVRDYNNGKDCIVLYDKNGTVSIDEEWEATEENFYKAYDECVRLFRGGE